MPSDPQALPCSKIRMMAAPGETFGNRKKCTSLSGGEVMMVAPGEAFGNRKKCTSLSGGEHEEI